MKIIRLFFIFILSFLTIGSYAQLDGKQQDETFMEENLFLNGVLTDYYSGEILNGVAVNASVNGKSVAKGNTNGKGEFEMVLEYDKQYKVDFLRGGYITKTILISTVGVPENKKRQCPDMMVEITMFKPSKCVKQDIMPKPIGKAIYYPKKNRIDWDMNYSGSKIQALNQQLDDCEEQLAKEKEEQLQKEQDYKEVMKAANKAFSKKDWENAISSYKAAKKILPKKTEPQQQIDLINTEIAEKAEAEKQRAEEKARAEAEAKALAKAKAAEQQAETERLAKEKAEAEALAKEQEVAKQKELAAAAAKKAEEERIAKEKAKAEQQALAEEKLKAAAKKEANKKKLAEQKAKEQEKIALQKAKEQEKAKLADQKEADTRAAAEAKALANKKIAEQQAAKEKVAKEIAAKKALAAEKARKANEQKIATANKTIEVQAQLEIEKAKEITPPTKIVSSSEIKGKSSIKIKRKNPTRHLYEKPNKHRKGKGPTLKKRIVF